MMNSWSIGNLQGLIPIIGGIYLYLLVIGVVPKEPRDPVKLELWRKKFGSLLKWICPILICFGVLKLFGTF